MGYIINGKPVAEKITKELIDKVSVLKSKGLVPKLTIIRVGNNGSDLAYENGAIKRASIIGIETEIKEYNEKISENEFIEEIKKENENIKTNGILIFRPLPKHLREDEIKYIISEDKDIDCFSPYNVAKLMEGDKSGFVPCTPAAVIETLKHYKVQMAGKRVVVIGRSMVVGKPVSMLLLNENCTVTICHSKTLEMKDITSKADILIVGVGKSNMINSSYIKENAVVIDVGINVDSNGNLRGDVDTEDCINKACMITPVPGGIGSITTSILCKHVVEACIKQNKL
ncbi:MAG: methenyltetrahydrofolate cyclohydrolase [Clostridiaceae bacterium]|jgi:methylenetetrahydrofolate dehydrogenase (NADP+)/methenyltetrahydrofolate cyclohydrolase|nr:methenyltetrahydrofolate cyclohydrolase [Clostridiaceae bacterium]